MLDLKAIREDPEAARAALARRGAAESLDELLRLDARRRELLPEIEEGRARQNKASEAIAAAKALIPVVWSRSIDDATAVTAAAIAARRVSKEGQEGLRAFLEKRAPAWSIGAKDTKQRTKDTKV